MATPAPPMPILPFSAEDVGLQEPAILKADGEGFESVDATGFPASNLRNLPNAGEAESEAVRLDSGLQAVVDAWPRLSEPIKAAIAAMIRATD